jgi:hypothetical protein
MAKRKTHDETILQMRREGKSLRAIATVFGCSKTAVRKQILRLQKRTGNQNPQDTERTGDKAGEGTTEETFIPKVISKYLRKVGTTQVFAYTDQLMMRGDMVPYVCPIPVPDNFEVPKHELDWLHFAKQGFRREP